VEVGNRSRPIQFISRVTKPDDLAVCGVQERTSKAIKVIECLWETASVPFSLSEAILWSNGEAFRLNNADHVTVQPEGIIGRAIRSLVLLRATGCMQWDHVGRA
jgi:hypothetical protein